MEIVSVKNLSLKYQSYSVLEDVSFSIQKGDYVALVGPNGAGKTTLIKALMGLVDISSGCIDVCSQKIGYLQQKVSLNDSKFPASVREIVKSGLLMNKKFPRFYSKNDEQKVDNIISKIGIKELQNKLIGQLSGGELQKVLLSRALISEPEILFLDEPTTALDPLSREGFYKQIKDLNENNDITVLLISHDIGSVGKFAKKILYIDTKLIFYGNFDEFCKSQNMKLYFGDISQHFFCQRHH